MFRIAGKAQRRNRWTALCSIWLALSAAAVGAQPLVDPTRPALVVPAPATPTGDVETEAVERALVLTSIIHGSERRLARLNGQWIREGERFDGGALVRVHPDRVQVRTPNGQDVTLNLTPAHMWKRLTQQLMDN